MVIRRARTASVQQSFDVVIVGAGPAGAAAALQIAMHGAGAAGRTLLLDAQRLPREKPCGGGLVPEADRFLEHLGVTTGELGIPSVPIEEILFEYPGGSSLLRSRRFFHVVHRRAFDAALSHAAAARGVLVRHGEPAVHFERAGDRIRVETASGTRFEARVVIGADGARSRVRRVLVGSVRADRFVALETVTRGHDGSPDGSSRRAVFDFRPAANGLWGYAWDFPSLRDGEPWMNRGLAAGARSSDEPLASVFASTLAMRGIEAQPGAIEGAGAPFYEPDRPQGADRVLLAGDAVGIDPWFGEGISVALGTGIVAGHAAVSALKSGFFDFSDHARRIRESAVGWSLERKGLMAALFYPAAREPGALGAFLGSGEAA
jgi:geranylgeranyl reductase family protein